MTGAQVKRRRLHKLATQLSFDKVLHSWHHLVWPAHQLVHMSIDTTKINSSVHNQATSTNAICMQSSIALSQGDLLNTFLSQRQKSWMLNIPQSRQCNRLQSRDVCKMKCHVKKAYRACLMHRRTKSFLKAGSRLKPCGSCSLCGSGLSYSGRQCDAPLVKDCANPCNAMCQ